MTWILPLIVFAVLTCFQWLFFRKRDPASLWGLVFIYSMPLPLGLAILTHIAMNFPLK